MSRVIGLVDFSNSFVYNATVSSKYWGRQVTGNISIDVIIKLNIRINCEYFSFTDYYRIGRFCSSSSRRRILDFKI